MKKLNLFWWNSKPNIGDFASFYIVSHLYKGKIVHKQPYLRIRRLLKQTVLFLIGLGKFPEIREYLFPWEKVLFGVGSIIDYADDRTIVWGSGFREPSSSTKCKDFRLVRGILSRNKIGNESLKVGDPALTLPLFYQPSTVLQKNSVVLIPHFADYEYFRNNYSDKYEVLKIESNDLEKFVDAIVGAKYVLSTSLHGLIIAHAYGIPAIWMKKGYIDSSEFKFLDYFSSVGIEPYQPIENIEKLLENSSNIEKLFIDFEKKSLIQFDLKQIQMDIIATFPF